MNNKSTPVFDNSYTRLPGRFYSRRTPVPVPEPGLVRVNHDLARFLGFDPAWLASETGVEFISGNHVPEDADPIAAVYAGHQFGGWNPQLGDGRAILLGEVIAADGNRYDVQLKGSGRTPYSRGGDGRAPLGPVLREYLISEAMAALGVPTTRALAAATSGEWVYREGRLPGAVLVRVASSHIRIGSIQFFASKNDYDAVRLLVDHVIQRHYPQSEEAEKPVRHMLDAVIARQAELIARWQSLGFIHGVMNTDNMLLCGETIDYGPCAWMDAYDPATVYSSIDQGGRYAYGNQPHIAHWNLAMLTRALLPLLDEDAEKAVASGQAAVDAFPGLYTNAYRQSMAKKLGLEQQESGDDLLIDDLLGLMTDNSLDFTLTFRHLADIAGSRTESHGVGALIELPEALGPWLDRWRQRLQSDSRTEDERQAAMYSVNPVYIPRNHLVEEAIEAAVNKQDFRPFHELVEILGKPCEFEEAKIRYAKPPRPEQVVRQTFCGT